MKLNRTTSALIAGTAVAALALAGCSSDGGTDASGSSSAAATTSSSAESSAATAVTFDRAYIKAKPADKNMTGIFGVIGNNTDEDITLTGFSIKGLKEGTKFEQHATADGKMFEVDGGHTIPAGGEFELVPGGAHLMVMDNDEAMEPGQQYTIVLNFSDGSTLTQELDARVQAAGEEDYGEDGGLSAPGHARPDSGVADEHAGHEDHEGH